VTDQVLYLDRFQLKEGKVEDFRAFAEELTQFVQEKEHGAVSYHYFLEEDGSGTAIFVFADADALDHHLNIASEMFMRSHDMIGHAEIEVLGTPSDQAREMTTQYGGRVKPRLVGFSR
jgi:quinol monooxygenase YgiN